MELNNLYEQMYLQIFKDNEVTTDKQMKKVYREIKKAMNETISSITELFAKYGDEGKLKLTARQKFEIRQNIDTVLKKTGKTLANKEVKEVTSLLEDIAKESYYKTAFLLGYGLKSQIKFNLIRQEFIDTIVNMEFKGEMFSSRIWTNKDKLIKRLKLDIEDAMKGNKTVDQVARSIKKNFATTTYESKRLARTEMARVQIQAQDEIGRNAGVKKQLFTATLDDRTSKICRKYDGRVYDIDDPDKPVLPLHPNERSLYINIPFEGWQPKKRKDNSSKEIIDYKEYNEWLKDRDIT